MKRGLSDKLNHSITFNPPFILSTIIYSCSLTQFIYPLEIEGSVAMNLLCFTLTKNFTIFKEWANI